MIKDHVCSCQIEPHQRVMFQEIFNVYTARRLKP